jgi:hypothetical protein
MVFNLLPADLGRPLSDITHRLNYKGLISDAEQVLDSLRTIEREVQMDEREVQMDEREVQMDEREGQMDERGLRWFMVRIAPYRTATTASRRGSRRSSTSRGAGARKNSCASRKSGIARSSTRWTRAYYLCEMIFDSEGAPSGSPLPRIQPCIRKTDRVERGEGPHDSRIPAETSSRIGWMNTGASL